MSDVQRQLAECREAQEVLARAHTRLREERDDAVKACEKAIRERQSLEIKEDDWHTAYERAQAAVVAAERERDAAVAEGENYAGYGEILESLTAQVRAGGNAADALREIARMAGPGESGTGAAGWILTLQAPRIAREALATLEPDEDEFVFTTEKVTDRHALCCRECRERAAAQHTEATQQEPA